MKWIEKIFSLYNFIHNKLLEMYASICLQDFYDFVGIFGTYIKTNIEKENKKRV